jgi:prefoldin subunit 5
MVDRTQLQRLAQEVEMLRKRLDEINMRIEQVDAVLAEHAITDAVLEALLGHGQGASISTHLPIGSGISLPYRHKGAEEGVALVDLGSGVFGERHWSDARSITHQRREDIQRLREELKQQSDQTETSLGQAAQSFNALAETLKKQTPAEQPSTEPPNGNETPETPSSETASRRPRKRGMFGGDLTLDD